MTDRFLRIGICLCAGCILSGCSLISRSSSSSDAEIFSKMCINSGVEAVNSSSTKKNTGYSKQRSYRMVDARGIEFDVIAENKKIAFIEATTPFYDKNLVYSTDYKACVIEYYKSEIDEILASYDVKEYTIRDHIIDIKVNGGETLEDIATMIISLDELLAFDYHNNGILQDNLGDDIYWYCSDSYDLLISMRDENNKSLLYETYLFSDNNNVKLTYEILLKTLELNNMIRLSGNNTNIIMLNGQLYVDSGEISNDKMEGEADGKTLKRMPSVPKEDGQTNFGAGVDYQFASDDTLYVFLSDGRHIFKKY